jgi:hypothetical protein
MACQGQVVLANYLLTLTTGRGKSTVDNDMEFELLKCLKKSVGITVGGLVQSVSNDSSEFLMP